MANRRPNFQIPDVINPPGRRCIQINIPDDPDHLAIFAGLVRQLTDWQRWERDSLKRGTLVAQVWRDVWFQIDWSGDECMGCCPEPTNRRYNAAGELEVSYDDGATWDVDKSLDDRYSGIISPVLDGADGDDKRCIGATAGMEYVKRNLIDDLTTGASFADLNAAAVAIVAALGVTGVGILVAAAAAAIFMAGVAAVQAAFTSDVWADYQCILYCNSEDDASFTEAGWAAVKAEINSTFSGVTAIILYNWVNSVGMVGLTNTLRSGFATEGDCSECECDDVWCYHWNFAASDGDWIKDSTGSYNNGFYISSSGWSFSDFLNTATTPDSANRAAIIERNFDNTTLTKITVTYNYDGGTYDNPALQALIIRINGVDVASIARSAMIAGSGQTFVWEGNLGGRNQIGVFLRSSRDISSPYGYSGNLLITDVQAEGIGENPIDVDNCI